MHSNPPKAKLMQVASSPRQGEGSHPSMTMEQFGPAYPARHAHVKVEFPSTHSSVPAGSHDPPTHRPFMGSHDPSHAPDPKPDPAGSHEPPLRRQ